MAERQGYIGRAPGDSSVIIASQTFEPSGIQTNFTFTSGYTVGYLDVYYNGVRLIYANDYTATDGSTVGLTSYAQSGDVLECVAYKAFNVGNVTNATGNFDVGNQLSVTGPTTATNAYYTGVVTATSFAGDGSALTGVASTDNIITGTAVTITNTTNSTSVTTGALQVSGGVGVALSMTVGGNLSVGGTITYEDVTNQDVIGLATFRSGVQFGASGVGGTITAAGHAAFENGLNVSGVATVSGNLIVGGTGETDKTITVGESGTVQYDRPDLLLKTTYSNGEVILLSPQGVQVQTYAGEHKILEVDTSYTNSNYSSGSVKLNNKDGGVSGSSPVTRLETNNIGVEITGVATVTGNSFVGSAISMYASSGIVSATSFWGDGSNLEGVSASGSSLDITSCLFI